MQDLLKVMLGIQDQAIGRGCVEESISGDFIFGITDWAGESTIGKSISLEILPSGGRQPSQLSCTLSSRVSASSVGREDTRIITIVSLLFGF